MTIWPAVRCTLRKSALGTWCRTRRHPVLFSTQHTDHTQNPASSTTPTNIRETFLEASDPETEGILSHDMIVHENFLTPDEEKSLFEEVEPYMKRLRYEFDHWDNAIHGYRETERKNWNERNRTILQRVKDLAFPPGTPQLAYIHILDISQDGYIKPHVDAVRFCGNTIAGLCLLSSAVMRLVREDNKEQFGDVLLRQRSLYIMKNAARYKYTHEVLPESESVFRGEVIPRQRRMSIICRNEPDPDKNKQ